MSKKYEYLINSIRHFPSFFMAAVLAIIYFRHSISCSNNIYGLHGKTIESWAQHTFQRICLLFFIIFAFENDTEAMSISQKEYFISDNKRIVIKYTQGFIFGMFCTLRNCELRTCYLFSKNRQHGPVNVKF